VSAVLDQIIKSKDAERRRLRELPWPEKLELLDRLRERQLLLGRLRQQSATRRQASAAP
jgi:hypothetical protein